MDLVIVESPTKAKTISKFIGRKFKVLSSYGHVRDLPKSKLGIDLENNFEPHYIIPVKSKKLVTGLKKEAVKAKSVILATDEDREGEAIAFHLKEALGLNGEEDKTKRIVFHEITKSAIEEALKNPRNIDINMVDAQQARRVLDRLVGYKLSPFLWEKVAKRLSAGRVQSVALRLIMEREEEIRKFIPEEYWTIIASLLKVNSDARSGRSRSVREVKSIEAVLTKINNEPVDKLGIKTKNRAEEIVKDLEGSEFKVKNIEKKEMRRNPLPPFTTSTLQQTSAARLGFAAKKTMFLAQNLYEKGLITYMRTDSLNLSKESVLAAKNWLNENAGEKYAADAPRFFKTKSRLAQEAHEAIRPTNPNALPQKIGGSAGLERDFERLYELIWRRFIASQMPQAIFDSTRVEISASNKKNSSSYVLNANGSTLHFDGFLKIWPTKFEEKELPELAGEETLKLKEVKPEQHFTQPPARYNEASLIKILEEYGIGRPSTYAPTISVIQDRNYVFKNEDRRFEPTEVGELVNKILVEHFPKIVDVEFTAKMENNLDEIAEGKEEWQKVIKEFYGPFSENLEEKYKEVEKQKPIEEKTDEVCEKCGKPMVIKYGRFGKFMACSGFPECKNTKSLVNDGERKSFGLCPKCVEDSARRDAPGEVIMRRTKKRRIFYGCSRYPDCDYASWNKPKENEEKKQIEN